MTINERGREGDNKLNEGLRGPGCGHERGRNGADGDGPWFSKAPYKLAEMKLARRCRQSQEGRDSIGWLKVPCCQDLTRHILVRESFLSAERGCEDTEKMRKMGLAGEKLNSTGAKSDSDEGRGGRNTQLDSWTKRQDSQTRNSWENVAVRGPVSPHNRSAGGRKWTISTKSTSSPSW